MPRRRFSPSPEGTTARFLEDVLCAPGDCFPRVLCFFPLCIGLVMGFTFSLSTTLTAAPGVKPAIASIGFLAAAAALVYVGTGLPYFRERGCWGGLAVAAAASVPRGCSRAAAAAPRSSEVKEHPLVPLPAAI